MLLAFVMNALGQSVGDADAVGGKVRARGSLVPFGHGLHALALARTDQAWHIERTHLPPLLVPQPGDERLQKFPSASSQFAMARAPIGAQTSAQQR